MKHWQMPQMREWIGDREIQNLSAYDYVIKNKKFEMTIAVPRDDIEDDTYGVYNPMFQNLGECAARHPNEQCYGALMAGFKNACYDGKPFFSADHPVEKKKVSNLGTKKLSMEAYKAGRTAIMSLVGDKGITMADLKGTLNTVIRQIYGPDTQTRFRPHHFPFTEPSCEVDIQCHKCGGKGCPTCKGEGWIEVLGAGMVHPKVLRNCNVDPDVYSGFAFGFGLERLALGQFKISDMRLIFENDVRFLSQF